MKNRKREYQGTVSARLTAIIASAALALSMAGCASTAEISAETATTQTGWTDSAEGASAQTEDADGAAGSTSSEEAGAADTAAEAATQSGTAYTEDGAEDPYTALYSENTNAVLQTEKSTEDSMYDSGSASATCSLKLEGFQVKDSGYDALNAALKADTDEASGLQQEEAAGMFMYMGDDASSDTSEEAETMEYALETTVILKRADAKVFSYLRCNYEQFGGAHPTTTFNGRNYNAQTGEALSLKDVTTDYDGVYQYVLAELQERYKNSDETGAMYFDDYETTVGQYFYGANGAPAADSQGQTQDGESYSSVDWYMTDDAVVVIFDIYSIAPYAAGASIVSVPVSSGLLNSEFFG